MNTKLCVTGILQMILWSCYFTACKKDPIVTEPLSKLPVANAGPDARLNLSIERRLVLDGSNSRDPNLGGRILKYFWSKLSGPDVYYFNQTEAKASMIILDQGAYVFELRVTDVDDHVAKDTVRITATGGPTCNPYAAVSTLSILPEVTLDESLPIDLSFGKGRNSVVFAGGRTVQYDPLAAPDIYTSRFFVYDLFSKVTNKGNLSLARRRIGIAVSEREVFFAGGILFDDVTDRVDIFDISTKALSEAKLSTPRSSVSCEVAGNKVFFAGGRNKNNEPSDAVDVYDMRSRTWSIAKLSQARSGISVVSSGAKVFFVGGDIKNGDPSSRIDIYDQGTGQWSTMELSVPRFDINSSVLGSYIVFSGGYNTIDNNKIDQIEFMERSSLLTYYYDCLIAGSRVGMVYGSNMMSAVTDGNILYCLDRYVITRITADGNWKMSAISPDVEWFGLTSVGDKLYGISFGADSSSDGFVRKIKIQGIYF